MLGPQWSNLNVKVKSASVVFCSSYYNCYYFSTVVSYRSFVTYGATVAPYHPNFNLVQYNIFQYTVGVYLHLSNVKSRCY